MNSDNNSAKVDLMSFRICQVILPVTFCSLYVALITRILAWDLDTGENMIHDAWHQLGIKTADSSLQSTLMNSVIIVSIFIVLIVVVTLLILLVLYLGLHDYLQYYFYIPSLIIMVLITPIYIRRVVSSLNWFAIDMITLAIFILNFTALGLISIFGVFVRAPLFVQQFYLIHNSAMLSIVILDALPDWAPWILLGFLVIWDLFAVLAPFGPLKLIINMAEKGGIVDMPGLIYQTDLVDRSGGAAGSIRLRHRNLNTASKTIDSDDGLRQPDGAISGSKKDVKKEVRPTPSDEQQQQVKLNKSSDSNSSSLDFTERGVNIGLGDFIFYGLLIGLTCKGSQLQDYYTFLATLNAILLGLVITISILAAAKRALPALPISIALGLLTAVGSMFFAAPFANRLAKEQVFI